MDEYQYLATSEEDTLRLGGAIADVLPAGTTVALMGTLGAGKTRLVQAIAQQYGISPENVVSPTFVLCQEHHGLRTIYHLDAYRLRDDDEFLQLGPEEYFESDGITFLEWADRVVDCLPPERLEIHIEVVGDTSREFRFSARGEGLSSVLQALQARLSENAGY